jgi:hemolysin activation/secretion protein
MLVCLNFAQAQPSAGQLLQQNRELEPTPSIMPEVVPNPKSVEPVPVVPKPGQVTFIPKEFVFVGNTKVSSSQLQKLVSTFLGKPISFEGLNAIADTIVEYYRNQGWLARAVLPKQDITEGVVTIQIIEAKLGGISIDNRSKRVSDQRVEEWIYGGIPKLNELSLEQLDRALLTLNDLPDVTVSGTLQSGLKPGETILLLTVEDKSLFGGQASVDNYGDNNTGKIRSSVFVNLNGLFGYGDQLSAYGLYTEGNRYGRLSFIVPVGVDGLRVGVNGSTMAYRVLKQSFQSLDANGVADTVGIEASYPVIRSRHVNLVSVFSWNYSDFKNWTIDGLSLDQTYSTRVTQIGLSGNLLDGIGGGAINNGSVMLSGGDIGRQVNGPYNSNYGVAGNFVKMRYALNRNQVVADGLTAFISVSGQLASKNMDSSEQMYLGGPLNVRAYGSGQGAASQGSLTTFELRQNLPFNAQIAGFYDLGTMQTWKNNPAINTVSNSYVLQGYGVSLMWLGPYNINVKGAWARRTGSLSPSVTNYLNQNGGISANRFWLTASIPI